MAARLLEAGHDVRVWNRSEGATTGLVARGAVAVQSVESVLSADVVISMLANDEACDTVFGIDAVNAAPKGAVHVNMATISVALADELTARYRDAGVAYVAAPVLGRPPAAASGQLTIIAGGTDTDIDRVAPYLDVLGRAVWRVGATPSTANLVKIGVNYNLLHTLQALAESVNLIERGGVDGQTFVDILTGSLFSGIAYTGYGKAIAARDYDPGFTVALGLKDLGLAEQAAASNGSALPTSPVLRDVFEAAVREAAERDWSAVAEVTRARSS
jgi:3-hydroxyisobutyrate dehydrogenase-like beta-hydroxyacid dehydrogenase